MHAAAPEGQKDIVTDYLSALCFGDFSTRKRPAAALCQSQHPGRLRGAGQAHVQGNANMGGKQNLSDALAQMLPCIGFPRPLNAPGCVNAVLQDS